MNEQIKKQENIEILKSTEGPAFFTIEDSDGNQTFLINTDETK